MNLPQLLLLNCLALFPGLTYPSPSLGILHLTSGSAHADACVRYNHYYSLLPSELDHAPKSPVVWPDTDNPCEIPSRYNVTSATVFLSSGGNCTFFSKLDHAYRSRAQGVVLISSEESDFPRGTLDQHASVQIPVARIDKNVWATIAVQLKIPNFAQLYSPVEPLFEPNLIIIWLLAVGIVTVGGYWCGAKEYGPSGGSNYGPVSDDHDEDDEDDDFTLPNFSPIIIIVFIVMICGVLLLLYYFYKYLIYLVIGVFAIATVQGTFECFSSLVELLPCGTCRLPDNHLNMRPKVINILLFLFSVGLSIFWVLIRNEPLAWILQDFLAILLCVSILKYFHMPSLKSSTLLLLALLIYDVFFVFITPFFSAQGKSIMIQVATGEGTSESIPMVIKFPKIIQTALSLCDKPYSLIGLGDILLPGVFVSFCHMFDVTARTKKPIYFITSCIGYAVGMFLAFLVLVVSKSGQPALLYLCPCVLIGVSTVGLYNGDLKELWDGEVDLEKRSLVPKGGVGGGVPDDDRDMPAIKEVDEDDEQKMFLSEN